MIDPYFSGTKIEWLIAQRATLRTGDRLRHDRLLARLQADRRRHLTDYSNASRTMLFDIRSSRWDPELCELLGVDPAALPEPVPSLGRSTGPPPSSAAEVPVAGIAGDQQAALFGQACLRAGRGQEHLRDRQLRPAQHRAPRRPSRGEGLLARWPGARAVRSTTRSRRAVFVTGAAVQWLRDGLGIIDEAGGDARRSPPRWSPTTTSTSCPR